MSYKKLIEVAKYLEAFEAGTSQKPFDIGDFAFWLSDKVAQKPHCLWEVSSDISVTMRQQSPDVQIAGLMGRMSKICARIHKKNSWTNPIERIGRLWF